MAHGRLNLATHPDTTTDKYGFRRVAWVLVVSEVHSCHIVPGVKSPASAMLESSAPPESRCQGLFNGNSLTFNGADTAGYGL